MFRDGTSGPDGIVDDDALPNVGQVLTLRDGREVEMAGFVYRDDDVSALLALGALTDP
jgi:hypothetical protein